MTDECNACVRILTALLNQEGSRAQHLLKAIGSSGELTAAENGVQVQIPSNLKATVLTRWTKVSKDAEPPPLTALADVAALDTLSITCRRCGDTGPEGSARAFVFGPTPLQIVLCTNRLSLMNSEAIETALIHELIHIYDFRTRRMNLQDCHQLAYTEVRAAREGECRAAWWPASCVKERALTSTNIMFGEAGRACIRAVFETAMHDNAPFTPQDSVTEPPTYSNIQHASER
jgi:hypothetical protein